MKSNSLKTKMLGTMIAMVVLSSVLYCCNNSSNVNTNKPEPPKEVKALTDRNSPKQSDAEKEFWRRYDAGEIFQE